MTSRPSTTPRVWLWALLIAFLWSWFYMLGARTLVPTDEGRYAEMAREMLASQDWITLRLNGIKYFEKPPLQNWMNALSFALFGLGEWQARLWTGLCGLLGIGAVYCAGRRVFSRQVGTLAAILLSAMLYWAGMAHINTLDMGLSAMMAVTLSALLIAQAPDTTSGARNRWMLLCWAGMALATLSKALPGVILPGAVLVVYTLLARDWRLWTRLSLLRGFALFIAITAPWFILIALKNPEHPHFFFVHEHWERFTSKVHHREGAWYYFVPLLLLGFFPWTAWIGHALKQSFADRESGFKPQLLLGVWVAVIFLFFSASGSKLPSYILPIFPALALLLANALPLMRLAALWLSSAFLALLGIAGLYLAPRVADLAQSAYEAPLYQAYVPWLQGSAALLLTGALASGWGLWRRRTDFRLQAVLILAGSGYLAGQLIFLGHEPFGRYLAGSAHVPAMQSILHDYGADTPIYAVGRYEQALPFYLQHTLILVEHPDEMAFGLEQEPTLWLPERTQFIARWRDHQSTQHMAMAILRTDVYQDLLRTALPMYLIGADPKRVIVATFAPTKKP